MAHTPGAARESHIADYYARDDVQARILEYCGGSSKRLPTAAYVAAFPSGGASPASWDHAERVPPSGLAAIWARGHDLARSLWDSRDLLFFLELDYQNIDRPAEPFRHPADVFVKLEPACRAASTVFRRLHLPVRTVMTGRGYHFIGRVPLEDSAVTSLAAIVPMTPPWHAGVRARRPDGVTTDMTERQARASTGLGCLLEYVAHLILEAAGESPIPVVFNGTTVGRCGPVGRECVSIDFSHAGDPLDVRHVRVEFGSYQWHLMRPDMFGSRGVSSVPPVATLPRGRESLLRLLTHGRSLDAAGRVAGRTHASLPNIARGVRRLVATYGASSLGAFHRAFYRDVAERATPRALNPASLPPCVAAPLVRPNDLLLKPEYLQHVVRALMSRGWRPADIAGLVQAAYETDHGWGDRWTARMDPRTRAEFDVRVFAGLIAAHADPLVDFNCVSAQEKNLCPRSGCEYDLRIDRDRLAGSTV